MKTAVLDINGKKTKEITLPSFFTAKIREEIVAKALLAGIIKQPYAPSLVAGKQSSSSGKLRHRRSVWKSQYKRGISRIPRKIITRRGSQFNWIGAFVPSAVGGRRAHPPKTISMINTKKINKKEMKIAFLSSLSATANSEKVKSKYSSLEGKKTENLPFIVDSKLSKLKTKQLLESLKKILGKELFETGVKKKKIRAGKGKLRGRKYKTSAGMIIIIGKNEKMKTNAVEVKTANQVSINDLSKGGLGRLTIYTENAIKDLEERIK